jgi:hypothetical protein
VRLGQSIRGAPLGLALVLSAMLAVGPSAPVSRASGSAGSYAQVLTAYEARGTIPPCLFTAPQLIAALHGGDVYAQQYFADFSAAIRTALSQRAAGTCQHQRPGGTTAGSAGPPAAGGPGVPLPRLDLTGPTGAAAPAPLVLLAILGALGLVGLTILGGLHRRGPDHGQPGAWSHLWREAGWRTAGIWADFQDWLRSGA